jgi:dTDP-4-dehydrorhamnose reductase
VRILLLGNTGQLGWELERCLAPLGDLTAIDYPEIDLVDFDATRKIVRAAKPDLIVNATAYTAVDKAESERDFAMAVNATAPGILAEEATNLRAALVHYSTDYVFDGKKDEPYLESDEPHPLGTYGYSKWVGEQAVQQANDAHLVFRTAWVYSLRRESFVTKVLAWSRKQTSLKLVTDQISNPTCARMLAEITTLVLSQAVRDPVHWIKERKGIYHLAGDGYASRLEFGKWVLALDPQRHEQTVQELIPALTSEFPAPAERPLFSALNCAKFANTFGFSLPSWQSALRMALQDLR